MLAGGAQRVNEGQFVLLTLGFPYSSANSGSIVIDDATGKRRDLLVEHAHSKRAQSTRPLAS